MPTKRRAARTGSPAFPARAAASPGAAPAGPVLGLPRPEGFWRACALALAFFVPGLGLGLALLYWRQDGTARRFSRWCLVLAALGWLLAWACGATWSTLQGSESGIQPW